MRKRNADMEEVHRYCRWIEEMLGGVSIKYRRTKCQNHILGSRTKFRAFVTMIIYAFVQLQVCRSTPIQNQLYPPYIPDVTYHQALGAFNMLAA